MGRPRVYPQDRHLTPVRLPQQLTARLKAEAAAEKVSVNALVQRAIENYLTRLDDSPRKDVGTAGVLS